MGILEVDGRLPCFRVSLYAPDLSEKDQLSWLREQAAIARQHFGARSVRFARHPRCLDLLLVEAWEALRVRRPPAPVFPTFQSQRRWRTKEQVLARIKELQTEPPLRTEPTVYAQVYKPIGDGRDSPVPWWMRNHA